MPYLKIHSIKVIKSSSDEFVMSQPNGDLIVIDSVYIYTDDDKLDRKAKPTKELFEMIMNAKIEIKKP